MASVKGYLIANSVVQLIGANHVKTKNSQLISPGGGLLNLSGKAWNFEDGTTTGWSTYADAAGVAPVDGTGGSPNVTFAASQTLPNFGEWCGLFSKDAANRQGQGVSVDFTLPEQLKGGVFTFSMATIASSNFTGLSGTESARIYCYDVTNGALLPGYVDVAPGTNVARGFFIATTSTSYRFIIHVSGTGTSAWTLKVDDVVIGQQSQLLASSVSNVITVPYSAANFTSNSGTWDVAAGDVNNYQYQQVGNQMVLEVGLSGIAVTGTVSELYLKIPDGKTAGVSTRTLTSFNDNGTLITVIVRVVATESVVRISKLLGGNFSTVANNSDFSFQFTFPIAEWSSNIVVADRAVEEFAYNTNTADSDNTTAFGYGAAGVAFGSYTTIRNKRVQFQTPIQPTDKLILEVTFNDGLTWQDVQSVPGTVQSYANVSSVAYGFGYASIASNSTQVDVVFGSYRSVASGGYGAAGNSWAGIVSSGRWRLRKVAAGALVGYGAAKAPTQTLLTTGSGTYTVPAGVVRLNVRMIGGGGGGGGTTNSTGGGNTTFGPLTANGGNGTTGTQPGAGGTASAVPAGWSGIAINGSSGGAGTAFNGTNNLVYAKGGDGGPSPFGGAGGGGDSNASGRSGAANSGSGGGGGGIKNIGSGTASGAGGGSGSYVDVITTTTIASTYSYAIGGGGSAGGTNTSVYDGGTGGSGIIIVDEFYI